MAGRTEKGKELGGIALKKKEHKTARKRTCNVIPSALNSPKPIVFTHLGEERCCEQSTVSCPRKQQPKLPGPECINRSYTHLTLISFIAKKKKRPK